MRTASTRPGTTRAWKPGTAGGFVEPPVRPRFRAFGLSIRPEFPLPPMRVGATNEDSTLTIALCDSNDLQATWSGPSGPPVWETTFPDGCAVTLERGLARDYLFQYGDRARFHLGPGASMLRCAVADPQEPSWQRFLLDTVLHCSSLLQGHHALHGGAIELDGAAAAVIAPSGGGKTTLCAELIRRGGLLCADDIVVLHREADAIYAEPGPPLMNLPSPFDPEEFGQAIAEFEDQSESWVSVHNASAGPVPLKAVFVLRRAPGLGLGLEQLDATPVHLLGHSLGFTHIGRVERRLELLGDVADSVPIFQLTADTSVSPGELADVVSYTMARESAA